MDLQERALYALIDGRGEARADEIGRYCFDGPRTPLQPAPPGAQGHGQMYIKRGFSVFHCVGDSWGSVRVVQDLDKVAAERCVLHWGYRLSLIMVETGAVAPPLLHAGVR
jgi:hypothetical protein